MAEIKSGDVMVHKDGRRGVVRSYPCWLVPDGRGGFVYGVRMSEDSPGKMGAISILYVNGKPVTDPEGFVKEVDNG